MTWYYYYFYYFLLLIKVFSESLELHFGLLGLQSKVLVAMQSRAQFARLRLDRIEQPEHCLGHQTQQTFFDNYVPGLAAQQYGDGPDDHHRLWQRSESIVRGQRCLPAMMMIVVLHLVVIVVGSYLQLRCCL